MSALHKLRAFVESNIKRDTIGRFAPKDSTGMIRAAKVAHFVAAGHLPGGIATAKVLRIGANLAAKKLAGEHTSVAKEVSDAASELTGGHIGQFVGNLVGGSPGGAIGGLLGYVAADGIKHVKKVALEERAKLAKDDIFQAASDFEKVKMTGHAITKGLKRTSGEHRKELKNTVISWGSESVAGLLGNDIITNSAAEYVNPTDAQKAVKKLSAVKRLIRQKIK